MPTDHLVVLAAGQGTRMDPLTRTRPKVLLPVAGKPLVQHLLEAGREAGFRRATLVVHAMADQVRAAFGDGAALGLAVEYVDQGHTGGTGHAVAALDGHVEGGFVLASGDAFASAEDLALLRTASGAAVGTRHVDDARPFGLLDVEGGRVLAVREKVKGAGPGVVNTGMYRFDDDIVARCAGLKPSKRGEQELTDAVSAMAADGHAAAAVGLSSWREAGRPWDLLDLQAHLMADLATRLDGQVGERVDIDGAVAVAEGAVVHNGTRIEGPCIIGAGATLGPHAFLRPATSVGAGCHVGASVEIKNSILGDGTKVPHLSYVGDSVLGSGCNLGAGTQVANLKVNDNPVRVHWQGKEWLDTGRRKLGVVLGDGVKTGVNCSLNPGTVLAPGVQVGAGQVVTGWLEP